MRKFRPGRRMGLAALAGGLAFVGAAEAVELVQDGNFENTTPSSNPIVGIGGKTNPGVDGGWSLFSTYKYSTGYAMPLTNGVGANIGGAQFLRPYPSGTYGIANSSDTVTQLVSLTASTTLTPTKIDAGQASYTLSAWFSSYETQGDYSDLTLTFQDEQGNLVDNEVPLGGQAFVSALPTGTFGKITDDKFWGQDLHSATIPTGARQALITIHATAVGGAPDGYVDLVSLDVVDQNLTTPFVASANPPNKATSVGPVVSIDVGIVDQVTAVNTNTVRLYLDNQLVPAVVQKAGTNTTVTYNAGLLPALSLHTYSIAFSDNGATVTTLTNTFHFTVADYLTLPASLASPLGSEGDETRVQRERVPGPGAQRSDQRGNHQYHRQYRI